MPNHVKPHGIRDVTTLIESGLISEAAGAALRAVESRYDIGVTPSFQKLIHDADDPIGRQVIPSPEELKRSDFQKDDPIGDARHSPIKGVVHRYPDRALLTPLLICPIYCRSCFRRERVGADGGVLNEQELDNALDWFRRTPSVREVILTGGDPLMLSPRRLSYIISVLSSIDHIDIIRIHSRVPVADPIRLNTSLLDALETGKALWLVLHVNHASELTPDAAAALKAVQKRGITILSQSVLLKGVNDTTEALENLLRTLIRLRIKPYYLHHLDPAPGTDHFRVPIQEGLSLLRSLRGRVSGLAWPTYVLDIPDGYGKVPLGPDYLERSETGAIFVTDPRGARHILPREDF